MIEKIKIAEHPKRKLLLFLFSFCDIHFILNWCPIVIVYLSGSYIYFTFMMVVQNVNVIKPTNFDICYSFRIRLRHPHWHRYRFDILND